MYNGATKQNFNRFDFIEIQPKSVRFFHFHLFLSCFPFFIYIFFQLPFFQFFAMFILTFRIFFNALIEDVFIQKHFDSKWQSSTELHKLARLSNDSQKSLGEMPAVNSKICTTLWGYIPWFLKKMNTYNIKKLRSVYCIFIQSFFYWLGTKIDFFTLSCSYL